MAFRRWSRCPIALLIFLPLPAIASRLPDCPKAATSRNGQFLVVIDKEYERISSDESRLMKISYEIYPREEFSDRRIAFYSASSFWNDNQVWSVVQGRPDVLAQCPEPLITDDGKFLVLLHDTWTSPQDVAMWIYRQSPAFRAPGGLVKAIKLSELWPENRFPTQMLFTGGDSYWFAHGSFNFSADSRALIYKTPWGTEIRITLADGIVARH